MESRSKLDYGCIVYGSARKSYLQMLDPIHNQGLKRCLGAFRTCPVESLYVDEREPSLGARRGKLSMQYATKIKSLPNHPAHNAVFDNTYTKCNMYFWPSYQQKERFHVTIIQEKVMQHIHISNPHVTSLSSRVYFTGHHTPISCFCFSHLFFLERKRERER